LLAAGLGLALTAAAGAHAGSFTDGVAAQSRGDMAAALAAYRSAAERGEDPAEFALGRLYLTGQGLARDYGAARAWFEKAAALDNPGAAYQLGAMSQAGLGGPRDLAAAIRWYRRSAEHGYAPAATSLAEIYRRGDGAPKDLDEALGWAQRAAETGDAAGELELGELYADAAAAPARAAGGLSQRQFRTAMDMVFGAARWRETGGYRTRAEEDRLRAEGAGTVPAGALSAHSLGTPNAPGAYDIVVTGMNTEQAAARLRRSDFRFRRVVAEGAHGDQGPHLHVEPLVASFKDRLAGPEFIDRALAGAPNEAPAADDAEEAAYWLRRAAAQGETQAVPLLEKLQARAVRR
jgi:Sel1 repeat